MTQEILELKSQLERLSVSAESSVLQVSTTRASPRVSKCHVKYFVH